MQDVPSPPQETPPINPQPAEPSQPAQPIPPPTEAPPPSPDVDIPAPGAPQPGESNG